MKDHTFRIDAAAIADGEGLFAAPGSLLITFPHDPDTQGPLDGPASWVCIVLLAAGPTDDVRRHPADDGARVVALPHAVLVPGLVNAHTHLDLSHIGPRPHDPAAPGGFVSWIDMIRRERRHDPAGIAQSVARGIDLCLAGGTIAVGDIAGAPRGIPSLEPWRTLRNSPLRGTSFLEFFSRGKFREQGLHAGLDTLRAALNEESRGSGRVVERVRVGLQPHAPNTVAASSYLHATTQAGRLGVPICTHLAESAEERRFISRGDGPQRELLETLGLWDESAGQDIGVGLHPAEFLEETLTSAHHHGSPYLVAHANDATDRTIEIMASTGTRVAYCPRASEYFGADGQFGEHRYREMLEAGIGVALGTDSVVNLPPESGGIATGGMSIWSEMSLLSHRDGTDPRTLLSMGTLLGADALGLPRRLVSFSMDENERNGVKPREIGGILAIEPEKMPQSRDGPKSFLRALLGSRCRTNLLLDRKSFSHTGINVPV